jgi:hypothetical protein
MRTGLILGVSILLPIGPSSCYKVGYCTHLTNLEDIVIEWNVVLAQCFDSSSPLTAEGLCTALALGVLCFGQITLRCAAVLASMLSLAWDASV